MVEWSITAVLKTAVPRGTGGSNPSLSANKGVNQQVTRFTPFITPKFLILKKTALLKIGIFACIEIKNPHHFISNFVINNSHDIVCF